MQTRTIKKSAETLRSSVFSEKKNWLLMPFPRERAVNEALVIMLPHEGVSVAAGHLGPESAMSGVGARVWGNDMIWGR